MGYELISCIYYLSQKTTGSLIKLPLLIIGNGFLLNPLHMFFDVMSLEAAPNKEGNNQHTIDNDYRNQYIPSRLKRFTF